MVDISNKGSVKQLGPLTKAVHTTQSNAPLPFDLDKPFYNLENNKKHQIIQDTNHNRKVGDIGDVKTYATLKPNGAWEVTDHEGGKWELYFADPATHLE